MRIVMGCAAVIAVALLVGACGENRPQDAQAARSVASDDAATAPALPAGWRWEGFGGVLVGVPGKWAWGNSSQRIEQWCVGEEPLTPMMGRPGPSSLVGCLGDERGVDPSTLVANTGIVVELSSALDVSRDSAEGDQVVRRIGDVSVRVNAPADLRDRILATVHRADLDAHGCAMFLRATAADRPDPRDVTSLTDVVSVAACRYPVPPPDEVARTEAPLPLFSSLLLEDDAAADAIAAIAAAPVGGGPDNPGSCLAAWSYGDEFLVLQVDSAEGASTLHVRYSGCDHNGFDDGVTVRALTRDAVQPLVADANVPLSWSGGGAKTKIMRP
jgi:hypothetical protein